MVKAILRGVFALITLPIVLGVYWLISAGLIGLGATPTAPFTDVIAPVAIVWIAGLIAYPMFDRFLKRVIN